ncbi:MAG: TonB family protein [Alphaproteobacteria bacterium]|nr:TonB family protein [Alphaproteobacteria bacterium]MBL6938547.1 TonB family protein [Alphaproteobacteria bacterium]MBL7096606.1 TonB family protein [Alphaproteobacteria bacterium]
MTVPAEAIGETHTAPTLSADLTDIARKSTLRLRLRVAEDGSIKDASVDASTGSAQLDRIALAWVRAHWRYRPALRDGTPIAVTTTALVRF